MTRDEPKFPRIHSMCNNCRDGAIYANNYPLLYIATRTVHIEMLRIRISIESDDVERTVPFDEFPLVNACKNLDEIETSVEEFRKLALPRIEAHLLHLAQEKETELKKKSLDVGATGLMRSR